MPSTTPLKQEPRESYTPMDIKPMIPEQDHRQFQPLNRHPVPPGEPMQMNYQPSYHLPQPHHQDHQQAQGHLYTHGMMHNSMSNYTHQPLSHGSYHQPPTPSLANIPQYQKPQSQQPQSQPQPQSQQQPHQQHQQHQQLPQGQQHQMQPPPSIGYKDSLPAILAIDPEGIYAERLPENRTLRLNLINTYFERSAALRNLSFIHKPSFMKSFDQDSVVQDYGEPLLYVMCALGARYASFIQSLLVLYVLNNANSTLRQLYFDHIAPCANQMVVDADQVPGEKWAVKARQDAMRDLHAPDVHNLMTMVLLCDYGLREDKNAMVFVLISVLYRMVRLLSLDTYRPLEAGSTPQQIMERESEIRLVWACYYLDVLVGNGVEKNLCWRDDVPAIPLPCPEENFLSQTPSQPYFLEDIERNDIADVVPNLDFQAISILVLRLRSKVM